jgi:hypothetical protein
VALEQPFCALTLAGRPSRKTEMPAVTSNPVAHSAIVIFRISFLSVGIEVQLKW